MQAAQTRWGVTAEFMLAFAVAWFAGSLWALWIGQDANWDLRNYHFYNPYALLDGRLGFDIAPAQAPTYFNPLLDLPYFWLVQGLNDFPRVIAVIQTSYYAICVACLWVIADHLFEQDRVARLFALVIGVSGAAALASIGNTMNDAPIAALALGSLAALLKAQRKKRVTLYALSGLLMGAAVGLKLTAAFYGLAAIVALLVGLWPWRVKIKAAAIFGLASLSAAVVFAGPWMWTLYRAYGNPVFPFYNDIFRSLWSTTEKYIVPFATGDLFALVMHPFRIAQTNVMLVGEVAFRDPRFAVVLVLALVAGVALVWRRQSDEIKGTRDSWLLLIAFFAVGYVAWLQHFAVYRYAMGLEMLTGILIIGAIRVLVSEPRLRLAVSGAATAAIIAVTMPFDSDHVPFASRAIDVTFPDLPERALVLLPGNSPRGFLIPFARKDARFVGINNDLVTFDRWDGLRTHAEATIRNHEGPRFAIIQRAADQHQVVLDHFGFRLGECRTIEANLEQGYELCALRVSDA